MSKKTWIIVAVTAVMVAAGIGWAAGDTEKRPVAAQPNPTATMTARNEQEIAAVFAANPSAPPAVMSGVQPVIKLTGATATVVPDTFRADGHLATVRVNIVKETKSTQLLVQLQNRDGRWVVQGWSR